MARTRELPGLAASANRTEVVVPNWLRGFRTAIPDRHELIWIGGERGAPALNADMASGTEATREPADPNFEVLGTNMTSALATFAVDGGITLTTAGADLDQAILTPHLDTKQSGWAQAQWNTDRLPLFQCRVKTGAAITSEVIWVGMKLTNTPVVATDNDQFFLRYENGVNSGNWQACDSNNNTDTTTDTGVLVALSTGYHIMIYVDSSRVPHYYINGSLVANGAALKANVTGLIPYVGVQASIGASAAKAVTVRSMSLSQEYA